MSPDSSSIGMIAGQGGFDCHRPGSECQNGGRCQADGHCVCVNSWGLNCMYSSSDYAEGDVSCRAELGCMSKTCLTAQSGQPAVCVCEDGRTGPRCEQDRFQFKCFVDRIAYNIVPYGNFVGYIYRLSLGNYNNPQCRKDLVTNESQRLGSVVGRLWRLGMSQRVYFIVQYSPEGLRDYDEIVEFKCDYPPVQFREFTADLETQRLDPRCVLPPLGMSINNQGKSVTLGFRVIRYTFSPVLYINCQVSGCVPTTLNDVDRRHSNCLSCVVTELWVSETKEDGKREHPSK
ncbi:hypothetical protein C0Q70_03466 [Pomacea canaliculata]|uniref:EGF-like domain-containing protein n=1 Tax=Pomacea canaliculata TaxID=400727 RepID=A0A2T7PSS8_POMCA|nr:hypothetical protein C0Q70_03466 [Pomacea canaliculata]